MTTFVITSDHGRIGPLWWVNSVRNCGGQARRWGTFGFGRSVRFMLEVD